MPNFFQKRDPWGNGYAVWVIAALVFAVPFMVFSVKNTTLKNDVESWLPDSDPQVRLLKWYKANYPIEDRVIVTWEGSSLDDPRLHSLEEALEGELDENGTRRNGSVYVEKVHTPTEALRRMVDQDVEVDDAIDRLTGVLIGQGALKVRFSKEGKANADQARQFIQQIAEHHLGKPVTVADAAVKWEPDDSKSEVDDMDFDAEEESEVAEEEELEPIEYPERKPHDVQVAWIGIRPNSEETKQLIEKLSQLKGRRVGDNTDGSPLIEVCFFQAGTPVSAMVLLSKAGRMDRPAAFEELRKVAASVGIPAEKLRLGGRPVAENALNEEVQSASFNPDVPLWQLHRSSILLLSGIVGVVLSIVLMRSIRLSILVLAVSIYTTLATVSLIPATGGSMNMVLIVMPTLLMVLTLSGAIHVANYWRHAAGANSETSVADAYRMALQPCALASFTTAIGLASLGTSTLAPVRDFGLYSAVGCGISLLLVLIGLPSLMLAWPGKASAVKPMDGRYWRMLGHGLVKSHVVVTTVCLILMVAATAGLKDFRTETKVIRYFTDDSQIVQDYNFIESQITGVNPIDVIIRFDQETQENTQFFERMEIVREIEEKVRKNAEISGAVSLADFQPMTEKPPEDAAFFEKIKYNRKSNGVLDAIKEGEMPQAASFLTFAQKDSDWLEEGDKKLGRSGDELWRITAQGYVMADNDYQKLTDDVDRDVRSVLRYHAGADHNVTGIVPVFLQTQHAVLDSLIRSFGLAFVVIAIVMIFVLRNPIAGLFTMLPNLLPIGVVFGIICWSGQRIDIGTMITASVALGIAVDGTLHLLTWFRDGLKAGMSREEAIIKGLEHCGPAMFQTSAIVAIGLLMLAPAQLLLIAKFGKLMAMLIAAALVADIIFLPALLAGPLGRLIEKSNGKPKSESTYDSIPGDVGEQVAELQETVEDSDVSSTIQGPHQPVASHATPNQLKSTG